MCVCGGVRRHGKRWWWWWMGWWMGSPCIIQVTPGPVAAFGRGVPTLAKAASGAITASTLCHAAGCIRLQYCWPSNAGSAPSHSNALRRPRIMG